MLINTPDKNEHVFADNLTKHYPLIAATASFSFLRVMFGTETGSTLLI